jgi:hypothetical protein
MSDRFESESSTSRAIDFDVAGHSTSSPLSAALNDHCHAGEPPVTLDEFIQALLR